MENIDDTINTVKKNTFVSHVINFDDDTKNELTNMVQYLVLAIVPVLLLNKIVEALLTQSKTLKDNDAVAV